MAKRNIRAGQHHDRKREQNDLHHRTRKVDGRAQRNHEVSNRIRNFVLLSRLDRDRNGRGARSGTQRRDIRRTHVPQRLQRAAARNSASDQVLKYQHSQRQQQRNQSDQQEVADHVAHSTRKRQVHEDAENEQRETRNDDVADQLVHNLAEINRRIEQCVRLDRSEPQAQNERQNQRRQNLDCRRQHDLRNNRLLRGLLNNREIRVNARARLTDVWRVSIQERREH